MLDAFLVTHVCYNDILIKMAYNILCMYSYVNMLAIFIERGNDF